MHSANDANPRKPDSVSPSRDELLRRVEMLETEKSKHVKAYWEVHRRAAIAFTEISQANDNLAKAEKTARRSEQHLASILKSIGDAVIVTDTQGRVAQMNSVAEALTGWTEAGAQGRLLNEVFVIIHEETRVRAENPVDRVLAEKRVVGLANGTILIARDGTERPIDDSAAPVVNRVTNVIEGVVLVFRDVTERKRAEEAVQRSEERIRSIIETANDGLVTIDTLGIVESFNAAASAIWGYKPEEVIGKNVSMLMPSPFAEEHDGYLENYGKTGVAKIVGSTREVEGLHKNGHRIPVELTVSATSIGEWRRFTGIVRDIAPRKKSEAAQRRLESQLLQSEKMASVGQLAAGVAHEINNPMAFIQSNLGTLSGFFANLRGILVKYAEMESAVRGGDQGKSLELAQEALKLKEEMDFEYVLADLPLLIEESREGASRVAEIVRNLKDFSHADMGSATATNVNKGIESALKIAWNEIKYKATIEHHFGDIPEIQAYSQQLNQVFMNLLVNAAQAIKDKGVIRIRTCQAGRHVSVEIQDNGCGIPRENLARIFDPFFTTKEIGKGTGLGLHIASTIITHHGGTLSVQSEVGKGSTFTVLLPINHAFHAG